MRDSVDIDYDAHERRCERNPEQDAVDAANRADSARDDIPIGEEQARLIAAYNLLVLSEVREWVARPMRSAERQKMFDAAGVQLQKQYGGKAA